MLRNLFKHKSNLLAVTEIESWVEGVINAYTVVIFLFLLLTTTTTTTTLKTLIFYALLLV
jgi:hypothetical protein